MRIAISGLVVSLGSLGSLGCPPAVTSSTSTTAPLIEGDYAITVDGAPLAYHVHGRGPVCIVHPGGPGLEWSYLRMPEVERVMTLVYLEPPGTGASPPLASPKDYTLARYARLLDGAAAAFGLPRACVLGHSHGGFVAVTWAAMYPDHVAGLVLYDTAARVDAETRKEQEAGAAAYANEPWFAAAIAALERSGKVATDTEADAVFQGAAPLLFADWTHRQVELAPWLATVHAFASPMRGAADHQAPWDARAKLNLVHAPALVIAGAKDWLTPPPRADELVHAIAGAQLGVLANSGHMGHVEEPAAFAAAIADFARKLSLR